MNGNVEGRSVRRISANGVVGFRNGPKQVCLGSKDWCSIVALFTEGPPERSSGARGFSQLEFRGWDARGSVTERSHAGRSRDRGVGKSLHGTIERLDRSGIGETGGIPINVMPL